jgi:LemA protein
MSSLFPVLCLGAGVSIAIIWTIVSVSGVKQLAVVCDDTWHDVVHDLGRRHDLVPQLVATARPMLSEHNELLDGMLKASEEAQSHKAPPGERALDESAVSVTLQRLLVLVEQRPALKADPGFQKLRKQLVDVEEHLQSCRRAYNKNAKDLNKRSQSFPANVLAGREVTAKREVFELLPVGAAVASNGRHSL